MNRPCRKIVQFEDRKPRSITPSKSRWVPPPGKSSKPRSSSAGRICIREPSPLQISEENNINPSLSKREFIREKLCLVFSALKHIYNKDCTLDDCYLDQLISLEPKINFVVDELVQDIGEARAKECYMSDLLNDTRQEIQETREILHSKITCADCEAERGLHSESKARLQRKEAECENLSSRLNDFQMKIECAQRSSEEACCTLRSKESEIEKLKKVAKEYKKRSVKLGQDLDLMRENLAETKICLANAKRQLDEVLYEKQRNDMNIDRLDRIQRDIRDLRSAPMNNNDDQNKSKEVESRLQNEMDLFQKERKSLQEQINKLKKELEELLREKSKCKETLEEKERTLKNLRDELDNQKKRYETLQNDYNSIDRDRKNYSAKPQVDPFVGYEKNFSQGNLTEQKRIHELEIMTKNLEKEIYRLQMQNEESDKMAKNKICELKQQLIRSDSTNRSLHSYLNFLKRSYSSVFQANCNNHSQIFDLQGAKSCIKLSSSKLGMD